MGMRCVFFVFADDANQLGVFIGKKTLPAAVRMRQWRHQWTADVLDWVACHTSARVCGPRVQSVGPQLCYGTPTLTPATREKADDSV